MADVDLRKLEREFLAGQNEATLQKLISAYKRTHSKGIVFAIEETAAEYILYNVEHVSIVRNEPVRNLRVNITLSKNMLDREMPHTQEDWARIAKKEGYELPDSLTIYSILRALYLNFKAKHIQQTEIIQIRNILLQYFKKYVLTSTRIIYNEKEPDNVIHNWNTKKQTTITTEMRQGEPVLGTTVRNWQLTAAPLQTKAILGTEDMNEANEVLKWATNTKINPNMWLLLLPKQKDEWVLVLGVSIDGLFNIDEFGVDNIRRAFGVILD